MNFRTLIPNFLTCLNLVCGCAGAVLAGSGKLEYAAYAIGIAAAFDFFDGFAARLLKGETELGKQLDSLADMVTFGVVPGIILYHFIVIGLEEYYVEPTSRKIGHILLSMVAFLVPVFSALRLAKFNIDERQKNYFLGLPTPANAILIASFPLIMGVQYGLNYYYPASEEIKNYLYSSLYFNQLDIIIISLMFNPFFHVILSVVLSLMLVLPIPMLALKFRGWKWRRNKKRYIFLTISLLLLSTVYYTELYFLTIPIIILLYIGISVTYYLIKGKTR
ncbi:MAG: CDP-diacylglycerol--serine O-phosphatidyltransferase [Flavobacteriales bacterium]|nr:MAG: CDP-diacylglycerol--serine O-phosphatidyltransferase [Flavobacteriales bacterium]